ncbi:histidine phosphatase family protein [Algicella marina]|uniref:Histidine phosphatase family protein n=1 Tax=Algicella marina TaxID=2683284 RepID=A0A6P1SY10_9RHOB|nr:histidine phosphatase family protein [Algicella marina]QHQ34233.1 hypothetical protein GO499_03015 [Algicella marina]
MKERRHGFRRMLISGLVIVAVIIIGWWWWFFPITTTVFVVRHGEKATANPADPVLSTAGEARAQELAHVLRDVGIDAVYVTQFQRTQLTGAPVAAEAGVTPVQYDAGTVSEAVDAALADFNGREVVIVGHSNTVDDIIAALGVNGVSELAESQFDRLFVVTKHSGATHLTRLRYGADTP